MSKQRAKYLKPVADLRTRRLRSVVRAIEDVLAMAKRGEISSVVMAYEFATGAVGGYRIATSKGSSRYILVGVLEAAKADTLTL